MDRRRAITLLAAGAVAACSSPAPRPSRKSDMETLRYGKDSSQFGELRRPAGASRGVVVVIHGGFWQSAYDLSLGRPLASSLTADGWTSLNLEYRRVGNGGGWPTTFDDVAAGIDALAGVDGLDTARVVTLGHSAGGHLAVWAAGRSRLTDGPWSDPAVRVTAAVPQAGVLDLAGGAAEYLGGGAVQAFMGGAVDERYEVADPSAVVPLDVPVRCIHGTSDQIVPLHQSADYVTRATDAGGDAELIEVDGDHFTLIDASSAAWQRTVSILDDL